MYSQTTTSSLTHRILINLSHQLFDIDPPTSGSEDGQPSFVATRAHLEETLRRALAIHDDVGDDTDDEDSSEDVRRTVITFRPNITMPTLSFGKTNSGTGVIESDSSLTADRLRSVYMLVKNNVARECVPVSPHTAEVAVATTAAAALAPPAAVAAATIPASAPASAAATSIEVNDNLCVFRRHASAADRDQWSVEVGFPACSCHANDCNRIVLWDCAVCNNPCTECMSLMYNTIHRMYNSAPSHIVHLQVYPQPTLNPDPNPQLCPNLTLT